MEWTLCEAEAEEDEASFALPLERSPLRSTRCQGSSASSSSAAAAPVYEEKERVRRVGEKLAVEAAVAAAVLLGSADALREGVDCRGVLVVRMVSGTASEAESAFFFLARSLASSAAATDGFPAE